MTAVNKKSAERRKGAQGLFIWPLIGNQILLMERPVDRSLYAEVFTDETNRFTLRDRVAQEQFILRLEVQDMSFQHQNVDPAVIEHKILPLDQ